MYQRQGDEFPAGDSCIPLGMSLPHSGGSKDYFPGDKKEVLDGEEEGCNGEVIQEVGEGASEADQEGFLVPELAQVAGQIASGPIQEMMVEMKAREMGLVSLAASRKGNWMVLPLEVAVIGKAG